jgi:putative tryptophan/tyrosine transport system substrate-binding protein
MIQRRDFITLVGSAAAWPLTARAQQRALPVIGWLGTGWPDSASEQLRAFHEGLSGAGFVDGNNVAIEYRWEEGRYDQHDRLLALSADLVRRQVAVIIAFGGPRPTRAAKSATSTIPIVFFAASDPVAAGLVASLNRPGGNVTGTYSLAGELGTKQLGLIRELVPAASKIALLINTNSPGADLFPKDLQAAVRSLGLQLAILRVGSERDLDAVLASFAQQRPDALLIQADTFLMHWRVQIAAAAARHAIPAIAGSHDFAAAGGLMTYAGSATEAGHQVGRYAGRILKGEKPADLPVVQSTKFELMINLKTARALGINVPPTLLATADEVIE